MALIPSILAALVPLLIKLIDKFVPDMMTRKKEFHAKKKVINKLTTYEQIAKLGRKQNGIDC